MGRRPYGARRYVVAALVASLIAGLGTPPRPVAASAVIPQVASAPAVNAEPEPTIVVPFQAPGYRYVVVSPGGGPADFMQPGFNDSAFSTGAGGFGSGGGCAVQGTRQTTWPTNTDILLRKTIDLPPNTTDVAIIGGIDNDLFIYWNGELLGQRFHEGCPTATDFTVPVPQTAVVTGNNVLAIRARDRGSESWVDVKVVATLHPLTTPSAAAGADQSVVEGAVVGLDGSASSDPSSAPLSYAWALTGRTGPPITLSSSTSPTPRFQTLDDGVYRFALTVSNGTESATDEVVVTVTNAKPVLSVQADPAYEKSVALITTTFTDAGILDTHQGVLNWGDGSSPETLPVDAQGSGWGTLVASHVYAHAGSFSVGITVVDDDGGAATTTVGSFSVVVPVAIWANSSSSDAAMETTSGAATFEGLVHTNDDLRIRGGAKTFRGPTEYVRTLDLGGSTATFDPAPIRTAIKPFPLRFNIADYRPAGRAALEAGAAYHNMSSSCGTTGVWQVTGTTLSSGIYYATCSVKLNGSPLGGTITIAAEGDITVSGSGAFFDPYVDGLLFLSASTSTSAIRVDASTSTFFGYSFAERGRIVLTGSTNKFYCGILADQIDIAAQGLFVHGSACSRPARTVAPPTIVPAISVGLTVDKADALPGAGLSHSATVANTGSTVVVPGILGLENLGTAPATVTGHILALEYLSATDHAWHPLPGTITTTVRPNAYPGVTYPSGANAIDGAAIPPGGLASWGYAAVITLTATETALLLDPGRVSAIRVSSSFTLNPTTVPVRRLFRFGDDFAGQLRTLGADATNVAVTIVPPAGDARVFNGTTTPALASLVPGESVVVAHSSTVPVPAPRGATESDAAYLARLAALDGTPLVGTAFARGTAGIGPVLAPAAVAMTTRHLPVVAIDKTGPVDLEPGSAAVYDLGLSNGGSAEARGIVVSDTLAGVGALPVSGAPATLAPAATATAHTSYSVPSNITNTTLANTGSVRWTDTSGNAYGPVNDGASTRLIAARKLIVTKTDASSTVGGQFVVDYDITITNVGAQTITGITLTDHLDPYTTLVAGSVRTSQGTITVGADPSDIDVAINVGTLANSGTVSIGFRAALTGSVPEGVNGISNQATVTSSQLEPIVSDDPEGPGATDPTLTPVVGTGGGGGGGGGELAHPNIGTTSPADGTVITEPTDVAAEITPADGFTVASWSILLRPVGGTSDTVIATQTASGGGSVTATGTVDPTKLPNGTYLLTIRAVSSDGGVQNSTTSLIVDGNLKLGRYVTTYQDLSVGVAGLPMQVLRTYDSFDKTVGDFGVGWNVGLANFRVSVNRPLGYGGWVQETFGCGFIFCQTRYHSTTPHIVTVVWPDGHQEIFDMTPANGSTFFAPLTAAGFTGRARTTSKLEADGDTGLSFFGDGNLYGGGFGSGGVYDPQRFRLTAKDGTVYLLDRTSGLVSATNRDGDTLTVDALGIHSSLGPSIAYERDPQGRIAKITGPDTKFLTYHYTGNDLTSVTDQNNKTVFYEYDPAHNLKLMRDPALRPVQILTYSAEGRLQTITDGVGNTTTVDVDPDLRTQLVTSPGGLLTTLRTFDDRGNPIRVDQIGDGRTLTTRFEYDEFDNVTLKKDPLNHEVKATWWPGGYPKTYTEPWGGTWHFDFNGVGDLLEVRDPTGTPLATFTYNPAGQLQTKHLADGALATYEYHPDGFVKSITDPRGTTLFEWTPDGHLDKLTGPDSRNSTYSYDQNGRLETVTDPTLLTTTIGHDGVGNVDSVNDGRNHERTYTYDYAGNLTSFTDAAHNTTTYVYDPAGRLDHVIDRNNQTIAYDYDVFGHVSRVDLPGGSVEAYGYDPFGNLVSADNENAELTFTYDDGGALASQISTGTATAPQPIVTLSFGRDPGGRLASIVAPWGPTTIGYNPSGFLSRVTDPQGGNFTLTPDPLGRLVGLTRPNGVNDTMNYNLAGQLEDRTSKLGAGIIDSIAYTYDTAGRRKTLTDADGLHTFGYDDADRLISVDHPSASGLADEAFSYDAVGNRTTGAAVFDETNRLTSDAVHTYTYDDEGNLTDKVVRSTGAHTTYHWDPLHRLTAANLPNGTTVQYRYDALGRRTEVASPAGITRYVNLGANVLAEFDASNTLRASYVVTPPEGDVPGQVLESRVGTTSTYPLFNDVGSITALTDTSGNVTRPTRYSAFGSPQGAAPGTYAYGTYGFDAPTGLYYARARYYDPSTGRFLSEDPVGSINQYAYASDRPFDRADPTGRFTIAQYSMVISALLSTSFSAAIHVAAFQAKHPGGDVTKALVENIAINLTLNLGAVLLLTSGLGGLGLIGGFILLTLLAVTEAYVFAQWQGHTMTFEELKHTFLVTTVGVVIGSATPFVFPGLAYTVGIDYTSP